MRPADRDALAAELRARGLPEPEWTRNGSDAPWEAWWLGRRVRVYSHGRSGRELRAEDGRFATFTGPGWLDRLVDAIARELEVGR